MLGVLHIALISDIAAARLTAGCVSDPVIHERVTTAEP